MNIVKATRRFEEWLSRQTKVVKPDLVLKHRRMRESPFAFFRATFYRWIQLWPEVCPDLATAPAVLSIGDLHIENFGTWRDIEGRLLWGVNDFDEAAQLSYALDLVRLATSAVLALQERHLRLSAKNGCAAIMDGYSECLKEGGRPFVLAEEHIWLRDVATSASRDPVRFWAKMDALPTTREHLPSAARRAIDDLMPKSGLNYRLVRRVAGLGSLGHLRIVAIAEFEGGRIAREAKAVVPSAAGWEDKKEQPIRYEEILSRAVRGADPLLQVRGGWIVRRLAPYCSRIELELLPANRDEEQLLFAMGWETANIHLGSCKSITAVRKHLQKQKPSWLATAAKDMAKLIFHDWNVWKKETR